MFMSVVTVYEGLTVQLNTFLSPVLLFFFALRVASIFVDSDFINNMYK